VSSAFASVVFLKMPGFARRSVTEQARLRAQLEAVLSVTAAELDPRSRVVLDAADGAAVVVLRDPAGALRLAERALSAASAGLPLAIGINHGAVQLTNGASVAGLTGDGLAVAASAAELAPAPGLFASQAFRAALAQASPGAEAGLASAGTFADAGLRSHEFFRLDPGGTRRRARRYAVAATLLFVAIAGGTLAARVAVDGQEVWLARVQAVTARAGF
jgi:hypothetical protein